MGNALLPATTGLSPDNLYYVPQPRSIDTMSQLTDILSFPQDFPQDFPWNCLKYCYPFFVVIVFFARCVGAILGWEAQDTG